MYFWSVIKELLNFQNPLFLILPFSCEREKNTGEWSVETGVRISVVDANSWRPFEIKIVIKSALNKTRRMLLSKGELFYFFISYSPDIA